MEEGLSIARQLDIKPCKNLFLIDKQGNHYQLLLAGAKKFNAKIVSWEKGCSHLLFGSPNILAFLGTQPGTASILGLANDSENQSAPADRQGRIGRKIHRLSPLQQCRQCKIKSIWLNQSIIATHWASDL